jgi:hypothetical protein
MMPQIGGANRQSTAMGSRRTCGQRGQGKDCPDQPHGGTSSAGIPFQAMATNESPAMVMVV